MLKRKANQEMPKKGAEKKTKARSNFKDATEEKEWIIEHGQVASNDFEDTSENNQKCHAFARCVKAFIDRHHDFGPKQRNSVWLYSVLVHTMVEIKPGEFLFYSYSRRTGWTAMQVNGKEGDL